MTERTLWNKQNTKQNHSLFTNKHVSHMTKARWDRSFFIPKNESALMGTNRSVPQNLDRSKSAS